MFKTFSTLIRLLVNLDKSKEMRDLIQKEKKLHKEINEDYKKISQKIDDDFEQIKQSKLSKSS